MRQVNSASFEFFEPDQLDHAKVVDCLLSLTRNNQIKAGGETWACAWAPDNSYFAWSSGHGILHLIPWDHSKQKRHDPADEVGLRGRKYQMLNCSEVIWSLAFGSGFTQKEISNNSSYRHCRFDNSLIIAIGLASGKIKLWNCYKGCVMIELLDHKDIIRCLDFTKDGSLQLVSASKDGSLKLWDLTNEGNMYNTFKSPTNRFYSCRFSPNGQFIAAVGSSKIVYLWKKPKGKDLLYRFDHNQNRLEGHCNEVAGCDFSPDSALLVTAGFDTKVIIWETQTMQQLRSLGHMHPSPRLIYAGGANDHYVRGVSFARDGLTVASICDDGYARFWNLANGGDPRAIAPVVDAVSCAYSPDGSVLAVGCQNGDVEFFSTRTPVPSLLNLSRQVIRKQLTSSRVNLLPLPPKLNRFLQYQDFIL